MVAGINVQTTTTVHEFADGGTWAMHARPVHPMLRGLVERYGGFEENARVALIRRETPFAGAPLILTFGAPYLLSEASYPELPVVARRSFVAGLHQTFTTSETTGATWAVQIDLTPIGAYRIFALPMAELTNRVVATVDIFGPSIQELEQRLFQAGTWDERFDLIDAFLLKRLVTGPTESMEVAWVWRQLLAAYGNVPIASLADELHWSRKRLIGTFRDQLGMSPKMLGRVLRFQRALALDGQQQASSWSDLALRSGYYDQAHLIREFRAFTGITPGAYRRLGHSAGVIDATGDFTG